jgi:hypothetical protein
VLGGFCGPGLGYDWSMLIACIVGPGWPVAILSSEFTEPARETFLFQDLAMHILH